MDLHQTLTFTLVKMAALSTYIQFEFISSLSIYIVNLNEEFSAIHGPSIVQQALYIQELITHIVTVIYYPHSPKIHIIGHSMGGVVATFLFTLPNFDHRLVESIFMYATPFLASPAPITHQIHDIYSQIHETLRTKESLRNLSIISFMAGNRDLTVNSGKLGRIFLQFYNN